MVDDISEQNRREIHRQADLLDAVHVAVVATDLNGIVTHWNSGAEEIYGWTCAETEGRAVTELLVGSDDEVFAKAIADVLRDTGVWEGEFEARRKDGSRFPAHVRNSRLTDGEGRPAGVVGVSFDVSERVEADRELRSAHDYRNVVDDSMGEGLFTLDTEGRLIHLNRAAERLLGWRQEDLAGHVMHDSAHYRRQGGRPFAVGDRPLNNLRRDGEVVHLENEIFIRRDGSELPVEISLAPFEIEAGVRGSVVVFNDITQRKADDLRVRKQMDAMSWIGPIRDALAQDRLVLFAQPIVDLATGYTLQHELLIRLVDATGRVVPPDDFLPAAESSGLIVDIDRWVVRQAFELAGMGNPVALNLSAHSLAEPGLLDEFRSELERTSADPSLVVVELTETAVVDDEQAAVLFIERVTALGCKLALDDFGTGYGGFTYLKRLPIDYLKIDLEFVLDLATNSASRHVVEAVVSLARGFSQKTIAEGAEDETTLQMLRDYGVDFAQGYVLGRPTPVTNVLGSAAPLPGRA
ncbi:MAG: hypothetical protein QOE06_147 [Thermoleophilaceae bacterium]|jgi:PAS domain S-box-containing protein|nr:hypothetical protein [Thermoleophilaceae bacterium]